MQYPEEMSLRARDGGPDATKGATGSTCSTLLAAPFGLGRFICLPQVNSD